MQEVNFSRYYSIALLENLLHHNGIVAVNAPDNKILKTTSQHPKKRR